MQTALLTALAAFVSLDNLIGAGALVIWSYVNLGTRSVREHG